MRRFQAEIGEQAAEQEARRQRRAAALADRRLYLPPKLGRHKFQPLDTQVQSCPVQSACLCWKAF